MATGIEAYTLGLARHLSTEFFSLALIGTAEGLGKIGRSDVVNIAVGSGDSNPYLVQRHVVRLARQAGLIHLHYPAFPPFWRYPRLSATLHDVVPYRYPRTMKLPAWIAARTALDKLRLARDPVTTSTAHVRDDLRSVGFDGVIAVIPHAVSEVGLGPDVPHPAPENYVAWLGTIEPRKRLSLALQIAEELAAKGSTMTLRVAGRMGWDRNGVNLLRLAQTSEYLGYISDAARCDLLVRSTALLWTSEYEGFGLPLIEAAALGVPVVAPKLPYISEVLGTNALTFGNASEAADIIVRLRHDPEYRRRSVASVQDHVAMFSWKRTGVATAEWLGVILAGYEGPS